MDTLWEILEKHQGHLVEISYYGQDKPRCRCLECLDCNEVLFDTDSYELVAKE